MPRRVSAATMALETQPHALYRFFDRTDVLLYVGITYDLPTRLKNHRKGKPWWLQVANIAIEPYDTRQEALDAERKAIREEGPLHNDQHNPHVWVETGVRPEDIDGAWIEENWRKVHPCVRDHVVVPAWHLGRQELAEEILEGYTGEQLAAYAELAKERAEADGEDEPTGGELLVRSAVIAVDGMANENLQLVNALADLLRSLLPGRLEPHLVRVMDEIAQHYGEDLASPVEAITWLATGVRDRLDMEYFDALTPDEKDVFSFTASMGGRPLSDRDEQRKIAGRQARGFKERGVAPAPFREPTF